MDMDRFIADLGERIKVLTPLVLGAPEAGARLVTPPSSGRVLMLAPHMDDPEAVAITLRRFAEAGCEVRYVIACSSHGGVTDSYADGYARKNGLDPDSGLVRCKCEIRRAEQVESARMAGFVSGPPEFIKVEEDERGNIIATEDNYLTIAGTLESADPDIVLLPHGEDTNTAHIIVHRFFRRAAASLAESRGRALLGLYDRDAKTTRITEHLAAPFDIASSRWKTELLKAHRSQQERNLEQRGYGFDERVLRVNRGAWDALSQVIGEPWTRAYPFAETFQAEVFGRGK